MCIRDSVEGANISNSAGHDKDKLHATILFLRWMRNMFSDYVDDPELISALPVSYTHLDVYKRQVFINILGTGKAYGGLLVFLH